jgi:DNA-binding NtrC family response regulator
LGSSKIVQLDIRLVCATNRDLKREVEAGRFREDLYFRVSVVDIALPPLRERSEDVADLSQAILSRLAAEWGKRTPRQDRDALIALMRYRWPGNIRELENVLTKSFVLAQSNVISAQDIELPRPAPQRGSRTRQQFERDEAHRIFEALTTHRWIMSEVSRLLGIPRNTLYRKIEKYRIVRPAADV